jgi:hypothetical protein
MATVRRLIQELSRLDPGATVYVGDAHEPGDGMVREAEEVAYDPETRSVTILAYGAGSVIPLPKKIGRSL